MSGKPELIVRELLGRYGRLYAEDAGIRLADADLLAGKWHGDLRKRPPARLPLLCATNPVPCGLVRRARYTTETLPYAA